MKRTWYKIDDSYLDILVKFTTVLGILFTVLFGLYAYFNTVHPVFTKEQKLLQYEEEIQDLKKERNTLENEKTDLKNTFNYLAFQVEDLKDDLEDKKVLVTMQQQAFDERTQEVIALRNRIDKLQVKVGSAEALAIREIVLRQMDNIADEAMESGIKELRTKEPSKFDLQLRCIEIAEKGILDSKNDQFRLKAFEVLKLFANKKLEPGIKTYKPVYDLITFTVLDEDALKIIRK